MTYIKHVEITADSYREAYQQMAIKLNADCTYQTTEFKVLHAESVVVSIPGGPARVVLHAIVLSKTE